MSSIDKYLYELDHPKKNYDEVLYSNPREISSFPKIDKDKIELIKSVGKKFPEGDFKSLVDIYNNYDPPIENWGFVQSYYKDGIRILYPIGLTRTIEHNLYYEETLARDINEVSREYNAHQRVGGQGFTDFDFIKSQHDETDYYHLIYCSDGNVFLKWLDAEGIAYLDIDELGKRLAQGYKARLYQEEKFCPVADRGKAYRKVGARNLR